MKIAPKSEVYEPGFEEISDPQSPWYDPFWYESDLLPHDHEWFEIIGDFLFMRSMLRKFEYTGKSQALSQQQQREIDKFKRLLPDIEELIRNKANGLEFTQKWAEFCGAFGAIRTVKRQQTNSQKHGQYDRGTEKRRAWYASVYLTEKARGKKGPIIKRDIAKFAECIKVGDIAAPPLWNELKFEKILHETSNKHGPRLNQDLFRDMNIKIDIPYYANEIAPKYKLPLFEIKFPGSN